MTFVTLTFDLKNTKSIEVKPSQRPTSMWNIVDYFIFARLRFHENRTRHYFAKWWIRDQSLSRIYDSLVKPEVKPHQFLCPGIQILVYMKMRLLISVLLTFPIVDYFLNRPIDCQIIIENHINVVIDEVGSSIVCLTR